MTSAMRGRPAQAGDGPPASPVRLGGRYTGRSPRLIQPAAQPPAITPQQRLLMLDTWQRSGLPAGDFAPGGLSKTRSICGRSGSRSTAPAGLADQPKGREEGEQAAGGDQADDPDAQAAPSGMGLPADQRRTGPRPGPAGQFGGGRPGAA